LVPGGGGGRKKKKKKKTIENVLANTDQHGKTSKGEFLPPGKTKGIGQTKKKGKGGKASTATTPTYCRPVDVSRRKKHIARGAERKRGGGKKGFV